MNALRLNRHKLTAITISALLAVCGSGTQNAMHAAVVPQSAPTSYAAHGTSWMLPEAKGDDLLYVTSFVSSYVSVFSYPEGKLVGGFGYTATASVPTNKATFSSSLHRKL